jgi:hypothetical protein
MGDRLSRKQVRRLSKEADQLARKPHKTSQDRHREQELNAEFERDMRSRDKAPRPFADTGQ